jgi:hypothetical protein
VELRYQALRRVIKQRMGFEAELVSGRNFLQKAAEANLACLDADVLIVHILVAANAEQIIQHWRARDKTVLLDLSLPVVLDADGTHYQIGPAASTSDSVDLIAPMKIEREKMVYLMKLADGVITNSRGMLEDWVGTVHVSYIPDFLDLDKYLIHPYEAHQGLHVGIHICEGGMQKLSAADLLPALEVVGNRHHQARFIVYGVHPQYGHLLKLPQEQKWFIPNLEYNQWLSILPTLDIGILPKTNDFDIRCGRQDVLELMAMKIPWIASEGLSCHELRRYGWLVQNKRGTWERILDDMIENLETYRNETSEAYLYTLGQGIDENIEMMVSVCLTYRADILSGVE